MLRIERQTLSDRRTAFKAVAALRLNDGNKDAARCWLSSWNIGKPPTRERFFRNCDWRLEPAIAIFEVRREQSVRCIQSGLNFRLALGFDLAGQDARSLTPAAHRGARLANAWAIGEGLIMTGNRKFRNKVGGETKADEIYLPLSDRPSDDVRTYLMHSDWRPASEDWTEGRVSTDLDLSHDPHTAALATVRA